MMSSVFTILTTEERYIIVTLVFLMSRQTRSSRICFSASRAFEIVAIFPIAGKLKICDSWNESEFRKSMRMSWKIGKLWCYYLWYGTLNKTIRNIRGFIHFINLYDYIFCVGRGIFKQILMFLSSIHSMYQYFVWVFTEFAKTFAECFECICLFNRLTVR